MNQILVFIHTGVEDGILSRLHHDFRKLPFQKQHGKGAIARIAPLPTISERFALSRAHPETISS
jgi:hypothetical protein